MIKNTLQKLSYIGVIESDTDNEKAKKIALTLLPFYISIVAFFLSLLYLYFGNFNAFLIPFTYIVVSLLSSYYLYKTKKFIHFERLQLMMILLLPFILMWVLGGFNAGSFVFIWAFYAPVAATMYCERYNVEIKWFSAFILLLLISTIINSYLVETNTHNFPTLILEIFLFLNIAGGLGGIYFLIAYFIKNIKHISMELKRDRESLYNLSNDLQNVNKELEHLANNDLVTALPNRLYFVDIVDSMFQRAALNKKQVAIMFIDLDGFKAVNDTLGHDAGDMILKAVGVRLTTIVRASDTVARIGGDEFAIALGDITEIKHVEQIAKTIIQEINQPCEYKGDICHVGASIGISLYPDHGQDIEELLTKADKSMYEIKKTGKNNYAIFS